MKAPIRHSDCPSRDASPSDEFVVLARRLITSSATKETTRSPTRFEIAHLINHRSPPSTYIIPISPFLILASLVVRRNLLCKTARLPLPSRAVRVPPISSRTATTPRFFITTTTGRMAQPGTATPGKQGVHNLSK